LGTIDGRGRRADRSGGAGRGRTPAGMVSRFPPEERLRGAIPAARHPLYPTGRRPQHRIRRPAGAGAKGRVLARRTPRIGRLGAGPAPPVGMVPGKVTAAAQRGGHRLSEVAGGVRGWALGRWPRSQCANEGLPWHGDLGGARAPGTAPCAAEIESVCHRAKNRTRPAPRPAAGGMVNPGPSPVRGSSQGNEFGRWEPRPRFGLGKIISQPITPPPPPPARETNRPGTPASRKTAQSPAGYALFIPSGCSLTARIRMRCPTPASNSERGGEVV
jgi:hypothetical protein